MTTFYKVFFSTFIVFIAVNLYAVDWQLGILHQENNKFFVLYCSAILGVFSHIGNEYLEKTSR